ncbi:ribonuclease III [Veillonella criceti]|uniref:Ribonuclease 3 n=1 Tax=Veillonella criceti TaxID=103891 RepID=A0A380NFH0_9FIRM|nr:ribonuclease III [Veillonella criceti]SUP39747.1 Ribonuclease 3 [Veillonella criceti]
MSGRKTHKTISHQAREAALRELVARLRIPLTDINLLDRAFTHTSYANENRAARVKHNERLEFLGDAVLDLIIGEYLFTTYPQMTEGELTKIKAATVCETSLATCSAKLNFGNYLLLGRGEATSGGRERASILADTFEAVIGALYVNTSYEVAAQFVLSHLKGYLEKAKAGKLGKDYKTMLQEYVQQDGEKQIVYTLLSESGPDHDKIFCMEVRIEGTAYGSGTGKSKKEAEQNAAQVTLDYLIGKRACQL